MTTIKEDLEPLSSVIRTSGTLKNGWMCAPLDLDPRDGDLQDLLELRRVAFLGGYLQLVRDVGEIIVRGPGGVRHGERDTAGCCLHRCQSSHEKGLEQRVRPSQPGNTSCSAGRSIRPRLRCTTTHAGSCGGGRSGTRRPGQPLVISPTRIGGEERCLNASAAECLDSRLAVRHGSAIRLPQHPDEHRPQRPVLLAVDQNSNASHSHVSPRSAVSAEIRVQGGHVLERDILGNGPSSAPCSPPHARRAPGPSAWVRAPGR